MINRIIILILIFVTTCNLYSSDTTKRNKPSFGVFASYNLTNHRSDFNSLPGFDNDYPLSGENLQTGFSAGIGYEWHLPDNLSIGFKLAFNNMKGSFSAEHIDNVFDGYEVLEGAYVHYLDLKLATLSIEPYLSYNVYGGFNVFAGGSIASFIEKNYETVEIANGSDQIVFNDTRTKKRNSASGNYTKMNQMYTALNAGCNVFIPIDKAKTVYLIPEVSYTMGASELIRDYDWSIDYIRMGMSMKFPIFPDKPKTIERTNYIIDTVEVKDSSIFYPSLKTGLAVSTYNTIRNDKEIVKIHSIKRTDTLFVPAIIQKEFKITVNPSENTIDFNYNNIRENSNVIPYIFFKENTDEFLDEYLIGTKYGADTSSVIPHSILNIQYNIVNSIGRLMRGNKTAKIYLTGCADAKSDEENCLLAQKRAEKVKNYITEVFGVAPGRIKIKQASGNCLPKLFTASDTEGGRAENRRVEVTSSDKEFFAPLTTSIVQREYDITPENIGLKIEYENYKNIDYILLNVFREVNDTKEFVFRDTIRANTNNISINLSDFAEKIYDANGIDIEVLAKENSGKFAFDETHINFNRAREAKTIERFSLILFDVDSDKIPENELNNIQAFLKRLPENTSIKISGFTDILGDKASNLDLSKRRAASVEKLLKKVRNDLIIKEVVGYGSGKFPPGIKSYTSVFERFLSRTVYIEVID